MKICIQLGHTLHKGVLLYSAVELVMLFYSADDMQLVEHGVIKVMTLYEEFCYCMDFFLCHPCEGLYGLMDGKPSGTQHPTPDREGTLSYPLETLIQVGGPHTTYR